MLITWQSGSERAQNLVLLVGSWSHLLVGRVALKGLKWQDVERGFFIDNLLVRIHFIIEMIRWTGLAPWKLEISFPGSFTSTFLDRSTLVWA